MKPTFKRVSFALCFAFASHTDLVVYFCMIVMTGVGWFVAYVYAVNDLTDHMHVSTAKALDINTVALFGILLVTPLAGRCRTGSGGNHWLCSRRSVRPFWRYPCGG